MNVTHVAGQDTPAMEHICEMVQSMVDPVADPAIICEGSLAGLELGLAHRAPVNNPCGL